MTAGERIRGQLLRRTPTPLLLAAAGAIGLWRALQWLAVHLGLVAAVALVALTWWTIDRVTWPWLVLATGCLCIALGAVMELRPRWWRRLVTHVHSRRRLAWYRERWEPAMVGAGLTLADDVPQLLRHRFGGVTDARDTDILTVRAVPGQVLEDWRHVANRLAAAWGCARVRVRGVSVDDSAPLLLLLGCTRRPLPDRTAVAGGQVPRTLSDPPEGPVQLPPTLSTPGDDPVDSPGGAFPRTPRGEQ